MLLQALLLTLAVLEEEGLAEVVGSCGEGVGALPEAVAAAGVGVAASGREAEGLAECERGLDAGPVGSALDVWGTVLELEGKALPLGEREAERLLEAECVALGLREEAREPVLRVEAESVADTSALRECVAVGEGFVVPEAVKEEEVVCERVVECV